MENKKNNETMEKVSMSGTTAFKQVTVTYTAEEAIRLVQSYDKMLNLLVRDVAEGEAEKKVLDDALLANIFVGRLRDKIFNAVLGEEKS